MSLAVDNGFSNLLFRFDYINCGVVREIDSQWNIDVKKLVLMGTRDYAGLLRVS